MVGVNDETCECACDTVADFVQFLSRHCSRWGKLQYIFVCLVILFIVCF